MLHYIKYNNRLINLSQCFEIKSFIDKATEKPVVSFTNIYGHTTKLKFDTVQEQGRFLSALKTAMGNCISDLDLLIKNQRLKRLRGDEDV